MHADPDEPTTRHRDDSMRQDPNKALPSRTTPRSRSTGGPPVGTLILALWLLAIVVIGALLGMLWAGGGAALRT